MKDTERIRTGDHVVIASTSEPVYKVIRMCSHGHAVIKSDAVTMTYPRRYLRHAA